MSDDTRAYWKCRICGETFSDSHSDRGIRHVNDEHLLMDQFRVLVYHDHSDDEWLNRVDDEVHHSEYDARTHVMKNVNQIDRLKGCIVRKTEEIETERILPEL